ncbi:MAG: acyl-CoA synthetase [Caldilineaceae bacterium]
MARISTLADVEAIEATPLAEQGLAGSTYETIFRGAQQYPDHPALIFFLQAKAYEKAVTWNYRTLLAKLHQTANFFHELGVGPTDTVSYILPNLPQTYLALYGGEAAGIACPINPLLEADVLADILNAAETKVLVTIGPFPKSDVWEKVASIADRVTTLETIVQVDIANYLSGPLKLLIKASRMLKKGPAVRARVVDFDSAIARQPDDRLLSGRVIGPDEIASYFHTGGTTGIPKLACHTHFNEVFDAWAAAIVAVDSQPGDLNYLGLPLFHNYGAIAIGLGAWSGGCGVVIGTPQGFRGEGVMDNLWRILDHYRCTIFSGVPTLYKALLNTPLGDADLSRVQLTTSGAAPLPVELAHQFTAHTGIPILEGYGLTEATSVASVNPRYGDIRVGSVGLRLVYQRWATAILDDTTFVRFCEPGEVGVVLLHGPNVFAGYRDDFHNRGAFVEIDGQRWLNTGDLGRLDGEGYLWLTGRKKELIIRGGHNIDPQMIEEPLMRHPAVALTAAVGRPDSRVGEVPVVYVELKPGATATPDELMTFARQEIGERAALPKEVRILDAIPLTAVGKVYKPALFHKQAEEVLREEVKQVPGVISLHVQADVDKRLGTVAYIEVTTRSGVDNQAMAAALHSVLGSYAIPCRLTVNGESMGV